MSCDGGQHSVDDPSSGHHYDYLYRGTRGGGRFASQSLIIAAVFLPIV
jgi:hypothetical protein